MSEEDPRIKFLNTVKVNKALARESTFEARIVTMILKAIDVPSDIIAQFKKENRLTIDEIEEFKVTLPVYIVSYKKLKAELLALYMKLPKTEVWKEFFKIRATISEDEHQCVGLVFSSSGGAIMICHDWSNGDIPRNTTRLSRLSADGELIVVVEPFKEFLAGLNLN